MILLRVLDPDLAAGPFSGLWSAGTFLFQAISLRQTYAFTLTGDKKKITVEILLCAANKPI